jgi:hypothetical protein
MLHKGPMPNEFTPFTEFAQLRLTEFLGAHPALLGKVAPMLGGWEFMGGMWFGEGLGFTDSCAWKRPGWVDPRSGRAQRRAGAVRAGVM